MKIKTYSNVQGQFSFRQRNNVAKKENIIPDQSYRNK